jgi:hypothetical protein
MAKIPGDTFAFQFPTFSSTGALTDADSLPTGVQVHNGVDDGTNAVTITHISTGLYKATGTILGSYSSGDDFQVRINATLASVASAMVRDYGALDTLRVGSLPTRTPVVRNQDAVTAPTMDDCLIGAWVEAYAKEPTFTSSSDNSGAIRSFTVTTDVNGNVTART